MIAASALALRLFEIESKNLMEDQSRWPLANYESELASIESKVFLYPSDESSSAFVLYRQNLDRECWVMNWACETKGAGLGSQVFTAFLNHARSLGAKKVGLEVRATNPAALKIYKRHGLQQIGERKNYYSNGDDALIFEIVFN